MASGMTRRELLRFAAVGSVGLALGACQPVAPAPAAEPAKPAEAPAAAPTAKCEVVELRCTHSWPADQWPRQVEFDNIFSNDQECINMTGENIVWADYVPKITAMAAAGSLPDVLYCQFAWAQRFIMDGVVINLQPFLESDPEFWGENGEDFAAGAGHLPLAGRPVPHPLQRRAHQPDLLQRAHL